MGVGPGVQLLEQMGLMGPMGQSHKSHESHSFHSVAGPGVFALRSDIQTPHASLAVSQKPQDLTVEGLHLLRREAAVSG
jgi:hypothetical protein